jgi:phosphoglycolate phosphatase-like HAD superfamily hydrolase
MEKCLILDFDDTLVKTIEIHADSWRKALEKVLDIEIPLENILADINYGMDVLLDKYQLSPKESKLAQKYKKGIFSKNLHRTKINELLLYLCKSKVFKNLVIASNSSRENVDRIMSYHQIDPTLFDYIYTREDIPNKKPSPDMGHLIFEKFPQYNLEEFLMVGDSDVDLTFARKLGIKCIIVKF